MLSKSLSTICTACVCGVQCAFASPLPSQLMDGGEVQCSSSEAASTSAKHRQGLFATGDVTTCALSVCGRSLAAEDLANVERSLRGFRDVRTFYELAKCEAMRAGKLRLLPEDLEALLLQSVAASPAQAPCNVGEAVRLLRERVRVLLQCASYVETVGAAISETSALWRCEEQTELFARFARRARSATRQMVSELGRLLLVNLDALARKARKAAAVTEKTGGEKAGGEGTEKTSAKEPTRFGGWTDEDVPALLEHLTGVEEPPAAAFAVVGSKLAAFETGLLWHRVFVDLYEVQKTLAQDQGAAVQLPADLESLLKRSLVPVLTPPENVHEAAELLKTRAEAMMTCVAYAKAQIKMRPHYNNSPLEPPGHIAFFEELQARGQTAVGEILQGMARMLRIDVDSTAENLRKQRVKNSIERFPKYYWRKLELDDVADLIEFLPKAAAAVLLGGQKEVLSAAVPGTVNAKMRGPRLAAYEGAAMRLRAFVEHTARANVCAAKEGLPRMLPPELETALLDSSLPPPPSTAKEAAGLLLDKAKVLERCANCVRATRRLIEDLKSPVVTPKQKEVLLHYGGPVDAVVQGLFERIGRVLAVDLDEIVNNARKVRYASWGMDPKRGYYSDWWRSEWPVVVDALCEVAGRSRRSSLPERQQGDYMDVIDKHRAFTHLYHTWKAASARLGRPRLLPEDLEAKLLAVPAKFTETPQTPEEAVERLKERIPVLLHCHKYADVAAYSMSGPMSAATWDQEALWRDFTWRLYWSVYDMMELVGKVLGMDLDKPASAYRMALHRAKNDGVEDWQVRYWSNLDVPFLLRYIASGGSASAAGSPFHQKMDEFTEASLRLRAFLDRFFLQQHAVSAPGAALFRLFPKDLESRLLDACCQTEAPKTTEEAAALLDRKADALLDCQRYANSLLRLLSGKNNVWGTERAVDLVYRFHSDCNLKALMAVSSAAEVRGIDPDVAANAEAAAEHQRKGAAAVTPKKKPYSQRDNAYVLDAVRLFHEQQQQQQQGAPGSASSAESSTKRLELPDLERLRAGLMDYRVFVEQFVATSKDAAKRLGIAEVFPKDLEQQLYAVPLSPTISRDEDEAVRMIRERISVLLACLRHVEGITRGVSLETVCCSNDEERDFYWNLLYGSRTALCRLMLLLADINQSEHEAARAAFKGKLRGFTSTEIAGFLAAL